MISEVQLIENLKLGDEEAFAALYERYSGSLMKHLFCMIGKQEIAEELLHEDFMKMLTKINFYNEDQTLRNSFKAWLFRLATNIAIDEIRKNKNIKFEEVSNEMPDDFVLENIFESAWSNHKIFELLSKLPLVQRTFLNLKVYNDLSHFEIARICSCQVNTVKQGLFQARKSLKNMILAEGVEL